MRIDNRKDLQSGLMSDYGQMGMMIAHLTQSTQFLDEECGRLEIKLQNKDKELEKLKSQLKTIETQLEQTKDYSFMMKNSLVLSVKDTFLVDGKYRFAVYGHDSYGLKLSKVEDEEYNLTNDNYVEYSENTGNYYISFENYHMMMAKNEEID